MPGQRTQNLGAVGNVVVEPTLMDFETRNYRYDRRGDIAGWDEIRTFKVEVKNIGLNFPTMPHSGSRLTYLDS